jgi:hypothetical protein
MAETLGSLCDKLTIVKLKQYHTEDSKRLESLGQQEKLLANEINDFIADAVNGLIPLNQLTFKANKVFKQQGNEVKEVEGSLGQVFAALAKVNCDLWHEQEKVYEFETVLPHEKDVVVKKLAILNLQRNKCIDNIDTNFTSLIASK